MNKKLECKFCGEKKAAKNFAKDKRTKTGYSKYCKACENENPIRKPRKKVRDDSDNMKPMEEQFEQAIKKCQEQEKKLSYLVVGRCPHCNEGLYLGLKDVVFTISKPLQ